MIYAVDVLMRIKVEAESEDEAVDKAIAEADWNKPDGIAHVQASEHLIECPDCCAYVSLMDYGDDETLNHEPACPQNEELLRKAQAEWDALHPTNPLSE